MTAREFFQMNQREGRAFLSPPPHHFFGFGGPGHPSGRNPQWIVVLKETLILCEDNPDNPLVRIVQEDETVTETNPAHFYLEESHGV